MATATVTLSINGIGAIPSGQLSVSDDAIVTAAPSSILAAQPATLTTRTNSFSGTLTMTNSAHGIVTGQRVDLYWSGGQSFNVTVGSVSGTSVPFTGVQTGLSAPATPTTASIVGGSLSGATYVVKTTYVNVNGETLPSSEASQVVAASHLLQVTSPVASGVGILQATGYNVYVSQTGTNTETKQNTTPIPIGTPWTLPLTDNITSGAVVPAVSTAHTNLPIATSAIQVGIPEQVTFEVTGSNIQLLACGCPQQPAFFVFEAATVDELAVLVPAGQNVWSWLVNLFGPNPVSGQTLTSVWISHGYVSSALNTLIASALTN